MIYCCEEHVDYALDETVDKTELPPILKQLDKDKLSTITCEYCGKPAIYMVAN